MPAPRNKGVVKQRAIAKALFLEMRAFGRPYADARKAAGVTFTTARRWSIEAGYPPQPRGSWGRARTPRPALPAQGHPERTTRT